MVAKSTGLSLRLTPGDRYLLDITRGNESISKFVTGLIRAEHDRRTSPSPRTE